MDVGGHHVSIDGKGINLSYKEFELLQYFMSNQGRALTRESILNQVWNYDYFGDAKPFSSSKDDFDADHYHDIGDLIVCISKSYDA